jgi:virulence-associated protein VagC
MTEMGGQEGKTQELPMNIDQVQQFVKENIIPTRDGRKCVDGRYEIATQDSGMIARPAGDLGYVMVLLALSRKLNLGLTPSQVFDAIYQVVTKDGGKFYLHTDHHADPDGSGSNSTEDSKTKIGCGHAGKAMDPNLAPDYLVDPDEMAELVTYAKQKAEKDPNVLMTNLNKEHDEQGVIVVKGKTRTINPQNNSGVQYFMYDQDRDEEFMQKLVADLNLEHINYAGFKEISDQQLQATLHNLALGKTIYQFNADEPEIKVEQVGVVN